MSNAGTVDVNNLNEDKLMSKEGILNSGDNASETETRTGKAVSVKNIGENLETAGVSESTKTNGLNFLKSDSDVSEKTVTEKVSDSGDASTGIQVENGDQLDLAEAGAKKNLKGLQDEDVDVTGVDEKEDLECKVEAIDVDSTENTYNETLSYNLMDIEEDGHKFVNYQDEDFNTDSDLEAGLGADMGSRQSKKKASRTTKNKNYQSTSSEEDGDRPWKSSSKSSLSVFSAPWRFVRASCHFVISSFFLMMHNLQFALQWATRGKAVEGSRGRRGSNVEGGSNVDEGEERKRGSEEKEGQDKGKGRAREEKKGQDKRRDREENKGQDTRRDREEKKGQDKRREREEAKGEDKGREREEKKEEDKRRGSREEKEGEEKERFSEKKKKEDKRRGSGDDKEDKDSGGEREEGTTAYPRKLNPRLARMRREMSDRDTQKYREGYPGKKDNKSLRDNLLFYTGKIKSTPDGAFIDDIHEEWYDDLGLLERHHGYIQWLFPIRESGMNWKAQELQQHEAEAIKRDSKAMERFTKSYEMMLHFYGIELVDKQTGEVKREKNYRERFEHLNYSMHNYLRITRILKCLGEMGLEHYKVPFLRFMLEEAIKHRTLARTLESCYNYWIGTVKSHAKRNELKDYANQLCNEADAEKRDGKQRQQEEEEGRGETGDDKWRFWSEGKGDRKRKDTSRGGEKDAKDGKKKREEVGGENGAEEEMNNGEGKEERGEAAHAKSEQGEPASKKRKEPEGGKQEEEEDVESKREGEEQKTKEVGSQDGDEGPKSKDVESEEEEETVDGNKEEGLEPKDEEEMEVRPESPEPAKKKKKQPEGQKEGGNGTGKKQTTLDSFVKKGEKK